MVKKSMFVIAALVAVMATGVTAATAQPKAQVTLKLLSPVENRIQWDYMIKQFNRQFPDITVEPTYVPSAQFGPTLLTQYQSGAAPDLFVTQSGASSNYALYALGSQGKLLDLSGSPWQKRLLPAVRKYLTVKQRYYGFPTGYATNGLLFNKDLFNQLGLAMPTDFATLIADCKKAAAAGKVLLALGLASLTAQVTLSVPVVQEMVYAKDPDWTLKRIQKKVTFASSPLWQRALQAIVEMKNAGCFNPAPQGTTVTTQYQLVTSGQAVGMPNSLGEITSLNAINPNIKYMQVAFPADNAKDTISILSTAQFVLVANKATEHPKEAKEFINFVSRPAQNALYAKVANAISPEDMRKGNLPPELTSQAKLITSGKAAITFPTSWPRPDKGMYIPQFIIQIPGLFTGQKSANDILTFMDQLWDRP